MILLSVRSSNRMNRAKGNRSFVEEQNFFMMPVQIQHVTDAVPKAIIQIRSSFRSLRSSTFERTRRSFRARRQLGYLLLGTSSWSLSKNPSRSWFRWTSRLLLGVFNARSHKFDVFGNLVKQRQTNKLPKRYPASPTTTGTTTDY